MTISKHFLKINGDLRAGQLAFGWPWDDWQVAAYVTFLDLVGGESKHLIFIMICGAQIFSGILLTESVRYMSFKEFSLSLFMM